jgi:hypothetical protein
MQKTFEFGPFASSVIVCYCTFHVMDWIERPCFVPILDLGSSPVLPITIVKAHLSPRMLPSDHLQLSVSSYIHPYLPLRYRPSFPPLYVF